jgi:hypothetical protein
VSSLTRRSQRRRRRRKNDNIANNQITGSAFLGMVGLDWQFSGVGNFSSLGESDMLLRNSNTGGLMVYDIAHNQITNAAFLGNIGLDWQFSGVGNFSGVPGESDLLLRNNQTGGLQVYHIANNQLTGSAFLGTVGLDWQFAGDSAGACRRRVRPRVAQRQHRRIRSLRHRQQSNHWSRPSRLGGAGLAARWLRGRSADRRHGQLGRLDLSTRAGNGRFRWRQWCSRGLEYCSARCRHITADAADDTARVKQSFPKASRSAEIG